MTSDADEEFESLEALLQYFGNPGCFQLIVWGILLLTYMVYNMIMQFDVFLTYVPNHSCKLSYRDEDLNSSQIDVPDSCSMYINPFNISEGSTVCIHGWNYHTIAGEIYPANEFDLVCERKYLLYFLLSASAAAVMIVAVVFGPLSDFLGRKTTLTALLFIQFIITTMLASVKGYVAFMCLTICQGIFEQGLQTVWLAYIAEFLSRKTRTINVIIVGFLSALLLPFQGLLFFSLGNWRKVQAFIAIIDFIALLLVLTIVPESVIWLVTKGKVEKAFSVLTYYAQFNGISPVNSLKTQLSLSSREYKNIKESSKKKKWYDLFRTISIARIMVIILFIWFIQGCVLSGASYALSSLPGNIYINYAINGAIQISIQVIAIFIFLNFPRLRILISFYSIAGIFGIIGSLLKSYTKGRYAWQMVAIISSLTSRDLLSVSVGLGQIYTAEVMPTRYRSTGIGMCSIAGRLGIVISPQMLFFLNILWEPLPHMVFSGLLFVACSLMLFLPETFNRNLPNEIEDLQELISGKRGDTTKNQRLTTENEHLLTDQKKTDNDRVKARMRKAGTETAEVLSNGQ